MHRGIARHHRLLDIVAITPLLLAFPNPAATALFTPRTTSVINTNRPGRARRRGRLQRRHGRGAMDGDHVTSEIVLAAKGAAARLVVAGVGLEAVGVMSLDVGLEVVRTSKGSGASRALVLPLRVVMHGVDLGPLGGE